MKPTAERIGCSRTDASACACVRSRGWWAVTAVAAGTAACGAAMVGAPALTRQGFGWMMFGDVDRLEAWGAEATAYLTLLHGVLGAVMLGWGLLLATVAAAVARGRIAPAWSWRAVAASVGAWFVVDQLHSIALGAWPNVWLNLGFGGLFAVALLLARPRSPR